MSKRILIVEDNLIPSLSLGVMLNEKGHSVIGKLDSTHGAVDLIKKENPDLIILDIRLKDNTNGLDLAREVREFSDVYIVFVSALTDVETINQMNAISHSQIISKPYTEADFNNALEKLNVSTD
ncbi:MAG: hypothetical protein Tsb0034_26830 [Ekhidna sp.]